VILQMHHDDDDDDDNDDDYDNVVDVSSKRILFSNERELSTTNTRQSGYSLFVCIQL